MVSLFKAGFAFGIWYSILFLSLTAVNAGITFSNDATNTSTNVNLSVPAPNINGSDPDTIYDIGTNFDVFVDWFTFSVFLPEDTPETFEQLFETIQSLVNIGLIVWVVLLIRGAN